MEAHRAREELARVGERARRGDLEREVLLERPPPHLLGPERTLRHNADAADAAAARGLTTRKDDAGGSASVTRTEPRSTSYGGGRGGGSCGGGGLTR